jgi:RNA polymerase sigma-54 factor
VKIGYELVLEQSQKLVMTPELIQAIKILQFTAQELELYVDEQLMANPVLELEEQNPSEKESVQDPSMEINNPEDRRECDVAKDEAFDWGEYIRERGYDDISYRQFQSEPVSQDYSYEQYLSKDISLSEYLMTQMQFLCLNTESCRVARLIIEALDENGYLTLSIDEIANVSSVDPEHIAEALQAVQSLDPPGVGARDLKECLHLQLKRGGQDSAVASNLVENHLEDIACNRISVIAKANGLSAEEAQDHCDRIRNLEPKPGRQFGSSQEVRYVSADVTVEKVGDEYIVVLNEKTIPRLSISSYYRKVLNEADPDSQITDFLNKRLNAAVWLIKSIEQRKRTIFHVVTAVVNHQRDFFDRGAKHLRPMTLAEIADEAGVHESTVSRAVNGKYVQTPRGLFELKYFFTGGVCDNRGTGVASESVKELLKEMIAGEDPHAPFSDQVIVRRLKEVRGIDLSRRTVAKYRDELRIPASSKRKRY